MYIYIYIYLIIYIYICAHGAVQERRGLRGGPRADLEMKIIIMMIKKYVFLIKRTEKEQQNKE